MQENRSYQRLPYLDGWRTIAVSLVILGHLTNNIQINEVYNRLGLSMLGQYGQIGVMIFFFISGYVVSMTCLNEVNETGSYSISGFYIRRIFRIIPPLLIYLSFCLLLSQLGLIDFSVMNFIFAAFYLCNNSLVDCGWNAGHTWSLAFEEQFYLLFPMMFAFIELSRRPNLFGLSLALLIAIIPFVWSVHYIGKTGFIIIYMLFILGFLAAKYGNWIHNIPPAISVGVFLISMLITFAPGDIVAAKLFSGNADSRQFVRIYYKFAYIVSIPLMVSSTGVSGATLNRALSNNAQTYIGRVSYSIYLWQQIATSTKLAKVAALIQLGALLPIIVLCVIQYEIVERRLIKLGRKISRRRTRSSELLASTNINEPHWWRRLAPKSDG